MNTLIFSTGKTRLKSKSKKKNTQAPAPARGFFIGTIRVPLPVARKMQQYIVNNPGCDMAYLCPLYSRDNYSPWIDI